MQKQFLLITINRPITLSITVHRKILAREIFGDHTGKLLVRKNLANKLKAVEMPNTHYWCVCEYWHGKFL